MVTLLQLSWDDILFENVLPYLSIKDCFSLRCVSKACKDLVESYLRRAKKINLAPWKTFNEIPFKVISNNCVNIQHLNLCQCKWLTDELIQPVFRKNTRLQYVNLSGCTGLTSSSLLPLILNGKELRCLKLKNCAWISAGCLEALVYHQCNLEVADFTCCWTLGDACLVPFLQKFRRLRVLCIANLSSITNITMFAIASYSKDLEHLNIQGCWRVTDDGVRMVGESCPKLQSLLVKDCNLVTEGSLESLRKRIHIDRLHLMKMDHAAPILGLNLQI